MLFNKVVQIKCVLASSSTGRSLIPSFQQLVDLTADNWLHFYLHVTMYADFNSEIEIAEQYKQKKNPKDSAMKGTTPTNKRLAAGVYHLPAGYLLSEIRRQTLSSIRQRNGLCHGYA